MYHSGHIQNCMCGKNCVEPFMLYTEKETIKLKYLSMTSHKNEFWLVSAINSTSHKNGSINYNSPKNVTVFVYMYQCQTKVKLFKCNWLMTST